MSIYRRHDSAPYCRGDADDEGMDEPDDERPQRTSIERPRRLGPPDRFTLHHIRQFLPSTAKVSYAAGGKLQWKQGLFGSLGIFQDPDAPSGDPE